MPNGWDEQKILRMIADQEPEGLSLEYKSAGALGKNNDSRDDITKEVSAMANSQGGVVIFGMACFRDRKHIPEKLDPIDYTIYALEWLGQKIDLIRPKIEGYEIFPVSVASSQQHVIYVVQIPQSRTAHQATDYLYYKRFDSRSVPMADYEIRDVMGRRQHPKVVLQFAVVIEREEILSSRDLFSSQPLLSEKKSPKYRDSYRLRVRAANVGEVYARYILAQIEIPLCLFPPHHDRITGGEFETIDPRTLTGNWTIERSNLVRDKVSGSGMYSGGDLGVGRYVPLLPHTTHELATLDLGGQVEESDFAEEKIVWRVHADNAPVSTGDIRLCDIKVTDKRPKL